MAATIDVTSRSVTGSGYMVIGDYTFDNSYPTGGESLSAAELGLRTIDWLNARQKGAGTRIVEYDYTNGKLMLFTALGTEAANASDQSTIVAKFCAFGDNASAGSS